MTPDERNLLTRYLADLDQARGGLKDAEAAQLIDQAFRANPDAGYVLVQHAILADQALHQAQEQIAALQRQLDQARSGGQGGAREGQGQGGGSFLGGAGPWGSGGAGAPPPQPQAYAPPQPSYAQPGAGYLPQAGQPGPFSGGGGLGSFLRSAGTTAAGVAGGAFLFEGLSGLFGGGRGGFGGGGFGGGASRPRTSPSTTTGRTTAAAMTTAVLATTPTTAIRAATTTADGLGAPAPAQPRKASGRAR